jgi:hypothetical protein
MADSGSFKHWLNGSPEGTVEVVANKSGSFKYWFAGSPAGTEYAAAAAGVVGPLIGGGHLLHGGILINGRLVG